MTGTTSNESVNRAAILAALDALGGLSVQEDSLVFQGDAIILPESMEGHVGDAVTYLENYQRMQERTYSYTRVYPYRPYDGAAAWERTMKKIFGSTGIGVTQPASFFSPEQPPEFRTIKIGPKETLQVPWGEIAFSPLDATFYTGGQRTENGPCFVLQVEAPRKHRRRIEGFFDAVGRELESGSIYKGKAITGAEEDPDFLDIKIIDASRVIYSEDVMTQLGANLWALLDHADVMRRENIPLKRAVLVEGPYGTGKTLAGALTAQRAVANGWTYVLCRPGVDDLMTTLRTAQLYAPAVVWFEDIDTVGSGGDNLHISRLLDALDGVTAKGVEVVAGFTTNHVESLQKGLLRPGRIDTVIHIGELDRPGIERLVRSVVRPGLLGEVDFDRVFTAFTGYVPAFAKEAIERAMRYSIHRNGGTPDEVTTDDLVHAAQGLRAQHRIMESASEGANVPTVGQALTGLIEGALTRTSITEGYSGNPMVIAALEPAEYDAL